VNILYLGVMRGTSLDRALALRRLGHEVEHVDPRGLLPRTVWVDRVMWHLGGDWLTSWILRGLRARLAGKHYDLCYVDAGHLIAPRILELLRQHTAIIVNYNIDDPLGPRDGARNRAYRRCVPLYDLCVVMREVNVGEARALGARNVMRVYMSADEVSHAPRKLTAQDIKTWSSEVLFLGTWMPERGPLLLELIKQGIPVTIRGSNWTKAPEWDALRPYWKGGALLGDDYAKAIQCAKVNIGLLSVMNRDLHTTRSLEIPALGSLLCAQRTSEHLAMYREGTEALFWSDPEECAAMCRKALENKELRESIARAGHARVRRNGHYNEPVLREILDVVTGAGVPEAHRQVKLA
jgi:spore maturation protein CgeB